MLKICKTIDLHTHSCKSDGSLSPSGLVELASGSGLSALALTDHDTVEGLDEAVNAGAVYGLEVIAGVELVAEYMHNEIHILGYFIDYNGQYFSKSIEKMAEIRADRNGKLLNRLNEIKINITEEDLYSESGGKTITRIHFARAMCSKGYINSVREAFERYLDPGAPAFVGRSALSFSETIDIIHKSGGVAALAHPYTYTWNGGNVTGMLRRLCEAGLDGVEAIYPTHDKRQKETLVNTAKTLGLDITGGSDFHGRNKPDIKIGTGLDNIIVEYKILEKLRERKQVYK